MENLSRNEVIAIFAIALTVVAAWAAAAAVQKAKTRFLLTLLTFALGLTFVIYIGKSIRSGKSSRELSKEEMVQEAKRQFAEQQAQRDEAYKQATERLERERVEREAAEKAAKEAADRNKAEQDARETIAREDAVKKLRDQMESERAQQARLNAEAKIIGKWKATNWWAGNIEFTKDGRCSGPLVNLSYRVIDSTYVEMTNWLGNRITWGFELSGDTLYFQGGTFTRIK